MKSEADDYPSIIECTVIYNHKKINIGDELVLHREKVKKDVDPKAVVLDLDNIAEPVAKKSKVSDYTRNSYKK